MNHFSVAPDSFLGDAEVVETYSTRFERPATRRVFFWLLRRELLLINVATQGSILRSQNHQS
jgi:hypothetical protein